MNITVIGTGYVGLVQGAGLAHAKHKVTCVDVNEEKINNLKQGIIPFYENGLEELVKEGIQTNNLSFSTNLAENLNNADIVFIAVGTPSREDGSVDMKYVDMVAEQISENLEKYIVVINKSTVPVGTGERVREIIQKKYKGEFSVVSNPEFLAQGRAVKDFLNPDRVVLGIEKGDVKAEKLMLQLYDFYETEKIVTDIKTSELIKYASNAFLATQISFINSLSHLCEKLGANIKEVAKGMKKDKRIGEKAFLNAGIGYGGSCFTKDIKGLFEMGEKENVDLLVLKAVEEVNKNQRIIFFNKIKNSFNGDLKNKKIGVWGLSFKPNTDDLRDAPSVDVINMLLQTEVSTINVYDPVVGKELFSEKVDDSRIVYKNNALEVLENIDVLVLFTEWDEFKNFDVRVLEEKMVGKVVVDGRGVFGESERFNYIGIG